MRTPALWLAALFGAACGRNYPVASPEERLRELDSSASAEALPTVELDLLVWNIKKMQLDGWPADFSSLNAEAELILIQEAYDTALMRDGLRGRSDMHWQMGISFFYRKKDRTATGVATGAVAAATDTKVLHAPKREPFVPTPKAIMLSRYALSDREDALLVINIHAINFRSAKHLRAHLHTVAAAIESHEGPVIFAGDFNTHHRPRLEVLEAFALQHGLRPAFPNWADGKPVEDGRMRHLRWPLDHVYLRGVSVVDKRVRSEIRGSDHVPLQVRLRVD